MHSALQHGAASERLLPTAHLPTAHLPTAHPGQHTPAIHPPPRTWALGTGRSTPRAVIDDLLGSRAVQVARGQMAWTFLAQRRLHLRAHRHGVRATRVEA